MPAAIGTVGGSMNRESGETAGKASSAAGRRHPLKTTLYLILILLIAYLLVAYLFLPWGWRRHESRNTSLNAIPRVTHTSSGIPGDPLNVALVGSEDQVITIMLAAKWYPADPITFKSSLRIAEDTVLHRPFDDAPVSSLYLWGRKEDLAFELPVGDDPKQRNHVRFWRRETPTPDGRPLWAGSATFDRSVGFSHTTGQITHHIAPDIDVERDTLIADLRRTGDLQEVKWIDGFQTKLEGHNGGGDPYHTDGRLAVGVIAVTLKPPPKADR
jgi:LssY-like putative type I secretion system component LssY